MRRKFKKFKKNNVNYKLISLIDD